MPQGISASFSCDYAALDAGMDECFAGQNGKQMGDPVKGMKMAGVRRYAFLPAETGFSS